LNCLRRFGETFASLGMMVSVPCRSSFASIGDHFNVDPDDLAVFGDGGLVDRGSSPPFMNQIFVSLAFIMMCDQSTSVASNSIV
jgi:hypothetical protein